MPSDSASNGTKKSPPPQIKTNKQKNKKRADHTKTLLALDSLESEFSALKVFFMELVWLEAN